MLLLRNKEQEYNNPLASFQHNARTLPISMFSVLLLLCSVPVAYLLTVNA